MKKTILALLLSLLAIWWAGCSKDQTPQPSNSHPDNWVKTTSASSSRADHGQKVLSAGMASCASCHGADLAGGTSKVSCFKCHDTYPHSENWLTVGHSRFHGSYLAKAGFATTSCTPCHGEDLQNSEGKKPCSSCHALYPHATGWMQSSSASFHGAWAKNAGWNLNSCQPCHGSDYSGGGNKQSCYTCHASYPHRDSWAEGSGSTSHGAWLAVRSFKLDECKACHGATLQGGDGKQACTACHTAYPHETAFKYEKSSSQFHGVQLKSQGYNLSGCSGCHGADFQGGIAKASCTKCHASYPHSADWTHPAGAASHVAWLRKDEHDLTPCKSCHGADYLGGTSGKSCTLCHTGIGGPENCTLCHGSADGIQPPKDTQGNMAETAMGVGRHKFHVLDKKYTCLLCHKVPTVYSDPGHVNDDTPGRAEVIDLWQWNHANGTCVTGCHENDPSKNYIWNH
ncbi:MAG TPA: hypothetical protein PLG50_00540 [bacterium]|nr:hypothetical protein [bacterium]HQG44128.1 hypothetical protein [bacterium]HQI48826.1 hypothetical protein [bacterium]HQJ64339.1 hypothetical protein [bacterium]HQJ65451.1 hypothetical protein [bacterium]